MEDFSPNQQTWILGSFAKVCVRSNSEEELMPIHDKAIELGLKVHWITDSGRTEFLGEQTRTSLAIEPDEASRIGQITDTLSCLISGRYPLLCPMAIYRAKQQSSLRNARVGLQRLYRAG
jgi:hypothetical protein